MPEYRIDEVGPDQSKLFTATAVVGGRSLGSGDGRTKKEAEQKAAMNALAMIHNEPIPFQAD